MARKPLSVWEKNEKQILDKKIKEKSVDALENIWKIANSAMDINTRLKANIFIMEKALALSDTHFDSGMNIRITVMNGKDIDNEKIENEIQRMEQEQENELWNDDDNWGEDVYNP